MSDDSNLPAVIPDEIIDQLPAEFVDTRELDVSELNSEFISGDQKKNVQDTHSWSSFWMNRDALAMYLDTDSGGDRIRTYLKLASLRRTIGNFVTIITGDPSIQVKFSSGNDSKTEGSYVIISADTNPESFDKMVGIALHEGAHCAYTGPLLSWAKIDKELKSDPYSDSMFNYQVIRWYKNLKTNNPDLATEVAELGPDKITKLLWTIVNVVEDRRIDYTIYRDAVGYRPYYDALYTDAWNSAQVTAHLIFNPKFAIPTIDAYEYRLINISNKVTPHLRDILPGMSDIIDAFDLENIERLSNDDNTADIRAIWDTVSNIAEIILTNAIKEKAGEGDLTPDDLDKMDELYEKYSKKESKDTSLPNLDARGVINPSPDVRDRLKEAIQDDTILDNPDSIQDDTEQALEDARNASKNRFKKRTLTQAEQEIIDTLEKNVSINTVPYEQDSPGRHAYGDEVNKIEYIKVERLTNEIMDSGLFPFIIKNADGNSRYDYFTAGIATGQRMGQILVNKIKVRNEKKPTKYTRKKSGRLDKRLVHEIGFGSTEIFSYTKIDEYAPALLHISVDASGSMGGGKWTQTIALLTSLAYASKKIRNLQVKIAFRYGTYGGSSNIGLYLVNVFDSRIDTFSQFKNRVSRLMTTGSTPESLTYPAEIEDMEMERKSGQDVYFITLTDGGPGYHAGHIRYGQEGAEKHIRKMIREMKSRHIEPMAYYIGGGSNAYYDDHGADTSFGRSYGEYGKMVPVTNFRHISKTINSLLMKSSTS